MLIFSITKPSKSHSKSPFPKTIIYLKKPQKSESKPIKTSSRIFKSSPPFIFLAFSIYFIILDLPVALLIAIHVPASFQKLLELPFEVFTSFFLKGEFFAEPLSLCIILFLSFSILMLYELLKSLVCRHVQSAAIHPLWLQELGAIFMVKRSRVLGRQIA